MENLIQRKYLLGFAAFVLVLIGVLFFLAFADPSNDPKGLGDAPVGVRHEAPRDCWESPDNFMNVCVYCIGANGTYVHTRPAAPIIISNDPNCLPGGILFDESNQVIIPASGTVEG